MPIADAQRDDPAPPGGAAQPAADASTERLAAYAMLAAAVAFWAGNFVVARALREELPAVTLNVWRWIVALAVLLPFVAGVWRPHAALVLRHWRTFLALGATGVAGFHTLVYLALSSTTVMNAVLIASTVPFVIVAFSYALGTERVGAVQAAGIAVSLAGALIVIVRGDLSALAGLRLDPGDLWMAAAVPLWAAYSVLLRRVPREIPQRLALAATTVAGLLVLAPVYAVRAARGESIALTVPNAAAMLYIGLFAAVVAFLLWNRGVALVGANRAGTFLHLMPVFGALLSYLFLGERLAGFHLAGGALVLAGIVLFGRGRLRTTRLPPTVGGRGPR